MFKKTAIVICNTESGIEQSEAHFFIEGFLFKKGEGLISKMFKKVRYKFYFNVKDLSFQWFADALGFCLFTKTTREKIKTSLVHELHEQAKACLDYKKERIFVRQLRECTLSKMKNYLIDLFKSIELFVKIGVLRGQKI